MDNFYEALASGTAKVSGVMNYIQHLLIAERCSQFERPAVLDACCGRGLLIPLLKRYSPFVSLYVGIDVCIENLQSGKKLAVGGESTRPPFPIALINGDITEACYFVARTFDVIVYTSALEHLDREAAVASIKSVARLLSPTGILLLSTPNTPRITPPRVQYKVHVYEWHRPDLLEVLAACGLDVTEEIGLIPPDDSTLENAARAEFGDSGVRWVNDLKRRVPRSFLGPILAASFPDVSREVLFVCRLANQVK